MDSVGGFGGLYDRGRMESLIGGICDLCRESGANLVELRDACRSVEVACEGLLEKKAGEALGVPEGGDGAAIEPSGDPE